MKKVAAVFVSIGVILVIAGLIMVGIFGGDALKDFNWSDLVNGFSHDLSKTNAYKEISGNPFSQIKITADRYSVYVLPDNELENVTVKYIDPLEGDANITVNCVDGVLTVAETDTLKTTWFNNAFKSNRFMAVYIPQTLLQNVAIDIEVKTAGISVKELTSTSSLTCMAHTGGIMIQKSDFNDIKLETNTGAVNVEKVNCNELTLNVNTGAINVKDSVITGKAKIEVNTGAVNYDSTSEKLEITTDTGSINFVSNASEITLTTDTGSINGTVLGNKADYQIRVKKDTGSSNIKNQDVENAANFLTVVVDTGSINIDFRIVAIRK